MIKDVPKYFREELTQIPDSAIMPASGTIKGDTIEVNKGDDIYAPQVINNEGTIIDGIFRYCRLLLTGSDAIIQVHYWRDSNTNVEDEYDASKIEWTNLELVAGKPSDPGIFDMINVTDSTIAFDANLILFY